jgi:hypothetical protein
MCTSAKITGQKNSRVPHIGYDISATRLSQGDPWAFRPILANGLVLSSILKTWLKQAYVYHQLTQSLVCVKMSLAVTPI